MMKPIDVCNDEMQIKRVILIPMSDIKIDNGQLKIKRKYGKYKRNNNVEVILNKTDERTI